jgi:hypothetical protein
VFAAPEHQQEEDRDQRELEEDVEEESVLREEDAEERGLREEQQGIHQGGIAHGLFVSSADDEGEEQAGEDQHQQADTAVAQHEAHAPSGHPIVRDARNGNAGPRVPEPAHQRQ